MSAEPLQQRLRMSYAEWWEMPDHPKAEWVDGEVVVSPATAGHMDASFRLTALLRAALPDLFVILEVGLQLPGNRVRVPDVMALEREPESVLVEDMPVLVAEVLSPSTRNEDLIRKSQEYLTAGISQFWAVDPEARAIDVLVNDELRIWEPLALLTSQSPNANIEVGSYGTVALDLREILPD